MRKHLATFVEDFERHGKQTAIVTYPGNRRVATSYAELAALTGRFSRWLQEQKIQPGERVLLWGTNCAEWVGAFFGCVLRGVLVAPLDASGGAEFAARVVADVSPRVAVGDENLLGTLPESLPRISFESFTVTLPREPLLTAEPSLTSETPLQILYTSGTTSAPKGIVHTHGNVLASVDVLEREIQRYLRYERWVHPLRFLHTLPLSHVFGQFMGLWVPPLLAAEVHYDDKLVAQSLIERIRRERVSLAAAVPRVLELMRAYLLASDPALAQRLASLASQRIWWRWWHFRKLHRSFGLKFWAFVSGGATLPEDLESFWNTLGFLLIQGYGMTETTALATLNHPLHAARGSIGKALAGREVRVAEDGEILVRGAVLAAGTWRNGRMEPRIEDWLHTGDLGAVDADGQVRFLGRKSDVIVAASGKNIHPGDLEQAMRAQPGVRDCMVVGWDGPRGPEPIAVVILESNIDPATLPEMLVNANHRLEEFQQIRSALRWPAEEFPRNSVGKPLRREVAAWVQRQLQSESPTALTSNQDALLCLLEQVTGESLAGTPDSANLASDLHLDSLGRMQLAIALEEQFGVSVSDEAIAAAQTIADLRRIAHPVKEAGSPRPDSRTWDQPDTKEGGAPSFALRRVQASAPKYIHWPWSAPVQTLRIAFLECLLRPLVALLAHPGVQCEACNFLQQPAIYICNHVTVLDVPLVLYALPRRVRQHMAVAMSAEILGAWRRRQANTGVGAGPLRWLAPLQAWAVTVLFNVFPLPAGAGLRQSFAHAGEAMDRGYNVLVFPEGQRTHDGKLQPFQTGISLLAQESRTAVVPIALAGLREASQRTGFWSWLRPSGLSVVVGAPLRQASGESHVQFTDRLRTAVEQLIP